MSATAIKKHATGIEGFDAITHGGLPEGRTTLIAGSAGSGKTIFSAQFLAGGIERGEAGVLVTFEETPEDIRRNVVSLGWDMAQWEEDGLFAVVDVSPTPEHEEMITGNYDLGALLARIEHAVRRVDAKRVVLDSLGAVFAHFEHGRIVRSEMRRIASALRRMNVTAVLTAERTQEYGEIARFGIEEFVADNVVILRNVLDDESRRRTVEILKFRGTSHHKGEYPFTILPDRGIVVVPLSSIELAQPSSNVRASSGSVELDRMLGGGFFRDSIILVSGATGTGKTLTVMHFIEGGLEAGEKVLFLTFEESREQLLRNAMGWGFDFESFEESGQLRMQCLYPEVQSLEDHRIAISDVLEEFQPTRVAIDSLSALERIGTSRSFREFVLGLTSVIKQREIAGLFTNTTPTLMGGTSVTEAQISTITDTIVLLRYAEIYGSMRRAITVLKMRGSMHDKQIREFTIDGDGMHIQEPFRYVGGILAGEPRQVPASETERMAELFEAELNDIPPTDEG